MINMDLKVLKKALVQKVMVYYFNFNIYVLILGATSLFDLFMGGSTRFNHSHGPPKGESKVIPLKYAMHTSLFVFISFLLELV